MNLEKEENTTIKTKQNKKNIIPYVLIGCLVLAAGAYFVYNKNKIEDLSSQLVKKDQKLDEAGNKLTEKEEKLTEKEEKLEAKK